jgi:hypothetical protein
MIQALRHFRLARWGDWLVGKSYVQALVLAYLALVPLSLFTEVRPGPNAYHRMRARLDAELKADGEKHLVLVRSHPDAIGFHQESWLYNEADIDGSRVIWARDLGTQGNRALLQYYAGRRVWRLDGDAPSPALEPYTEGQIPLPAQEVRNAP